MGDFDGAQLFDNATQPSLAGLQFQPNRFSSLDLFQRQNSFGFSPGTSPVANDIKNELGNSYFDSQSCSLPLHSSHLLAANDFRYPSAIKDGLDQNGVLQSLQQPPRLHIPSTTSKQKHGQLTPSSETTPTKEGSPAATLHGSGRYPGRTGPETATRKTGPETATRKTGTETATRKKRSAPISQVSESSSLPTDTARRRRKSSHKRQPTASSADGDDKRSQFLERNRVAASKCRQKKKEWTSSLEHRARELQASKRSLGLLVSSLREELLYLKGEALKHTTCDCNSVRDYLARHAEASLPRSGLEHAHSLPPGSPFSFQEMDIDDSIILDSPISSSMTSMTKNQDLPELKTLAQIPD